MKKILTLLFLLILIVGAPVFAGEKQPADYEKFIVECGYPYTDKGFASAISYGDYVIVDSFLKSGFNAKKKISGIPPTFYAVLNQRQITLEQLLNAGADVEATWGKLSLLLYTIESKNPYLTDIVINHGADINKTFFGITPLNYAIRKQQTEIATLLLKKGAKPEKQSLKYAKKLKNPEFSTLLQDYYDLYFN